MKKQISIIYLLISLNLTSQNYQEHNFNGNTQLNYQTFQEDLIIDIITGFPGIYQMA